LGLGLGLGLFVFVFVLGRFPEEAASQRAVNAAPDFSPAGDAGRDVDVDCDCD